MPHNLLNAAADDHDDDKPVGRILSRREILKLLGGSSAALVAGLSLPPLVSAQATATPSATPLPDCIVRPELTEGPYFVANELDRFDLRTDPNASEASVVAGLPLLLKFHVSDVTGGVCGPLVNVQVDVWQCDAFGVYSGVEDPGFDTTDQMWLRGFQITDEDGSARFLTIVPGWYSGRAVHIHFKIRTETAERESYEFTSQFFFDPDLIETIYAEAPYAANGSPDTPNERDFIYNDSDDLLVLDLQPLAEDTLTDIADLLALEDVTELGFDTGYSATFTVGLDLSDAQVGASDSRGAGGGSGGRGRP